jgi:hypothetical protein
MSKRWTRSLQMNPLTFRVACFSMVIAVVVPAARAVTYTATLLHPNGFASSTASGASGAIQAGVGHLPGNDFFNNRALLWSGSAGSVVDLNPVGLSYSGASAASGINQVGYAANLTAPGTITTHAILWSGTAASAVDLNPPGFVASRAYDVSGSFQVGEARFQNEPPITTHAIL